MTDIDWSKSPEGTTHYDNNSAVDNWIKKDNDDYYYESYNGAWSRWSPSEQTISNFFKKPIPVFTQKMADAGELPVVGMDCLFKREHQDDSKLCACYIIGYSKDKKWLVFEDIHDRLMYHNIKNGTFTFKPIDTRTDQEKAFDDYWNSISEEGSCKSLIKNAFDAGVKWVGNGYLVPSIISTGAATGLTAFNFNGYDVGAAAPYNGSGNTIWSYVTTPRKLPNGTKIGGVRNEKGRMCERCGLIQAEG